MASLFRQAIGSHIPQWESDVIWDKLKRINGSFAALYEEDCPVPHVRRAYLDLLPTLIQEGHAGKFLAFGYGPAWYAVGETDHDALAQLLQKYPTQMPKLFGMISSTDLYDGWSQRYYGWKAAKEKRASASAVLAMSPA